MSAYKTIGQQLGAELLTGLGQFKAGRGAIVTEWHGSADDALREFCELSGQKALNRALRNWMEWRNPVTTAHLRAIYDLCGPCDDVQIETALAAWKAAGWPETYQPLIDALAHATPLIS